MLNEFIAKQFRSFFLRFLTLGLLFLFANCMHEPAMGPWFSGPMFPSTVISAPPFAFPQDFYHEVGPMETLWRIGKIYNVDRRTLISANQLKDPDHLQIGQKLLIPNTYGPRTLINLYPTRRWEYIVIHHTATEIGNARTIDLIHRDRGFWNGLGYHFLIDNGTNGKLEGQIEEGPRWVKQEDGAHANADGMNQKGIGISLVGNFSGTDRVSRKQLDSLVFLVKTLQNYYHIPDDRVIGHRQVPGKNTECPGNYFPWDEFKQRLAY